MYSGTFFVDLNEPYRFTCGVIGSDGDAISHHLNTFGFPALQRFPDTKYNWDVLDLRICETAFDIPET